LVAKYHLPLILDFRDEWSLCPFDFVKKNRFNNQIERICIKTASRVIFTTEHHKQNYALLYPKYASKFSVIANGWEASDFEPDVLNRAPKVVSTEPVIAHVGALSFHTDPYSFICCFNTLAEHLRSIIKIKFVGKVALRYKQLAKKEPVKFSQIELMGQVPKSAVANVLDDSSMLLLLSNEGLQHYIPGKLYDYLVSGKPILVYGVYSESSRIVESLNAGIHVNENDSEGLYNAIEKILLDPLAFYNNERVDWIRSRTREELAKQFFNTLEDIT
jgi:glycosyltransferase involved in cell wall biosynthesis